MQVVAASGSIAQHPRWSATDHSRVRVEEREEKGKAVVVAAVAAAAAVEAGQRHNTIIRRMRDEGTVLAR